MKLLAVTGSRADLAPLEWLIGMLAADPWFDFKHCDMRESKPDLGWPDLMLVLGDRQEIMRVVLEAWLKRVPVAHIAGGDVTLGSYDDAMRDCISRMASVHFVTSTAALARLSGLGYRNVHLVGSPGIDYIKHADWKRERPFAEPYVVISYQPETIDGTNEIDSIVADLRKKWVFIGPNEDRGSEEIIDSIKRSQKECPHQVLFYEWIPHGEFLNLIYHCDEFIGNSSAMLYEAPEMGVKTRMIGKRQRGRTIPWGDGLASQRIIKILKYGAL
jgi:UDP-hydrolysing UDP-N-acetyl-D-glucosamine 2-epimerase